MNETLPARHPPGPSDAANGRDRREAILVSVGIAFAALFCAGPTLHADFTSGDDQRFVTDNILVARPTWAHAARLFTIVHGDLYQPLPMLSFQLDAASAEPLPKSRFGMSAFRFHLANALLHTLNALLAAMLAFRISRRTAVALLTGLLFACHPFAVETYAWVSGRMMLLATLFALVTLILCLSKRDRSVLTPPGNMGPHASDSCSPLRMTAASLAWLCSLLSKVIPTVPVVAVWLNYRRHSRLSRRAVALFTLLAVFSTIAVIGAVHTTRAAGFVADDGEFNAPRGANLAVACRYYLENYFLPLHLAPWVPPVAEGDARSRFPAILPAILEAAALLVVSWRVRRRNPTAFTGVVLFVILLAPFVAMPAARRFAAADRYMYLPMLGLHLFIAALLVQGSDWLDRRLMPSVRHRFMILPAAALLIPCVLISGSLAGAWTDTIRRDQRTADVYPDEPLTQYELAKAFNFNGMPDRALAIIDAARSRWPNHPRLAAQAGEAYRLQKNWNSAARELRFAAEKMPGHTSTQYHLALVLDQLNRQTDAIKTLEEMTRRRPGFTPAWTMLGRIHRRSGDPDSALRAFQAALKINPDNRTALLESARIHQSRSEWLEAGRALQRIVANDPRDAEARLALAITLVRLNRAAEAIVIYDDLIRANDSNPALRLNRAAACVAVGDGAGAEADYRHVINARPEILEAFVGLHELLARQGRFEGLIDLWRSRMDRIGDSPENRAGLAWAGVLNGNISLAERTAAGVDRRSPAGLAIAWAFIFDALQRGDDASLEAAMDRLALDFDHPVATTEPAMQADGPDRIILAGMNTLTEEKRQSRAGRAALAWLFMHRRDFKSARVVLDELAREQPPDAWTERASRWMHHVNSK